MYKKQSEYYITSISKLMSEKIKRSVRVRENISVIVSNQIFQFDDIFISNIIKIIQ